MSRSRLAYPLNRGADMDVGGAADLQTDVMRFMAIISLCLVAIFALVQSMPVAPATKPAIAEQREATTSTAKETTPKFTPNTDEVVVIEAPAAIVSKAQVPAEELSKNDDENIALTRPKWTPKFSPATPAAATTPTASEAAETISETGPTEPQVATTTPPATDSEGFSLRFESDAALTRLVAASQVGVYAITADSERAQRMTVSESRISFWEASMPNSFHEMKSSTVPSAVVRALVQSGSDADNVSWGVTLPGKFKTQMDTLMQQHRGGALVIGVGGDIRWETS